MRLLDVDEARYLFPAHKLRARKPENAKVVLPGVGRPALSPERSQAVPVVLGWDISLRDASHPNSVFVSEWTLCLAWMPIRRSVFGSRPPKVGRTINPPSG